MSLTMTPRLEVREAILDCTACPLHEVGNGPVPFYGPTPSRVAVLGEAPGRQEDQAGRPFVGRSGELIRSCLSDAGLDPDGLFWFNTVSCFPDDTPSSESVNACSEHRARQLELAGPSWVLVLGATALKSLGVHHKITRARAHVLEMEGIRYFPAFHPAFALRQAKAEQVLRSDVARFAYMVNEEHRWREYAVLSCIRCGTSVPDMDDHEMGLRFDNIGASYCDACWPGECRCDACSVSSL